MTEPGVLRSVDYTVRVPVLDGSDTYMVVVNGKASARFPSDKLAELKDKRTVSAPWKLTLRDGIEVSGAIEMPLGAFGRITRKPFDFGETKVAKLPPRPAQRTPPLPPIINLDLGPLEGTLASIAAAIEKLAEPDPDLKVDFQRHPSGAIKSATVKDAA